LVDSQPVLYLSQSRVPLGATWAGLANGLQPQAFTSSASVGAFAQNSRAGLFASGGFGSAGTTPSDGVALWFGTLGQT
jgi:hypothetical protein